MMATKKLPRVKTPINAREFGSDPEPERLIGDTVPDKSMSLREILDRHKRGFTFADGKVPIYTGEIELPDLNTMDLSDVQILKEQVEERIAQDTARRREEEDKKRKEAREKEIDAAADRKLEERMAKKRFKQKEIKYPDPDLEE